MLTMNLATKISYSISLVIPTFLFTYYYTGVSLSHEYAQNISKYSVQFAKEQGVDLSNGLHSEVMNLNMKYFNQFSMKSGVTEYISISALTIILFLITLYLHAKSKK